MYTDKFRNTVYIYVTKISDRLSYTCGSPSEKGEQLLRRGLRELYSIDLEQEERAKTQNGKPYLVNHSEVQYNISHSGKYVVCAFAQVSVGIDIQEKRIVNVERIGRKIFPIEEYREFLKSEEKQETFFRQWVMRESYLKWTGEGLTKDLRQLQTEGWHRFIHVDREYMCALWTEHPMEIQLREVE